MLSACLSAAVMLFPQKMAAAVHVIDTTRSTEAIPYEDGVTPGGGKWINVPVMGAPVHSGSPSLSLSYNSQRRNGVAGYGWDIGGASSIDAVPKTIYYDGTVEGVSPGWNWEAFSLDGIRLVPNDDVSFPEYQYVSARGDIFVKKVPYGQNISHFVVLRPDGSTDWYGFPYTDRGQYSYPITRHTDPEGYVTTYTYQDDGNEHYLTGVSYGSLSGVPAPAEIRFTYEPRPDSLTVYRGGTPFITRHRLRSVESRNSQILLRRYDLSYSFWSGHSHLVRVSCSNSLGGALNPLQFDYGEGDVPFLSPPDTSQLVHYFLPSDNPAYIRGRLQPNAYEDGMITFTQNYSNYGDLGNHHYGSLFPIDNDIWIYPTLEHPQECCHLEAGQGFQMVTASDINGDGQDEIVKITLLPSENPKAYLNVSVYKVGANGVIMALPPTNVELNGAIQEGNPSVCSPMPRCYHFGDYDGDGKEELLTISYSSTNVHPNTSASSFALIDLDSGTLCFDVNLMDIPWSEAWKLSVSDIDGDDKSELIMWPGNIIYEVTRTGFIPKSGLNYAEWSEHAHGGRKLCGDINGDGLSDYLETAPESFWEHFDMFVWAPSVCPACYRSSPLGEDSRLCRYCGADLLYYYRNHPAEAVCHRSECGEQLEWTGNNYTCRHHGATYPGHQFVDNGSEWIVHFNTGKGYVNDTLSVTGIQEGDIVRQVDIDSDGYMDLLHVHERNLSVYTWDGAGFALAVTRMLPPTFNGPDFIENEDPQETGAVTVAMVKTNQLGLIPILKIDNNLVTGMTDSRGNQSSWRYRISTDRTKEEMPEGGHLNACYSTSATMHAYPFTPSFTPSVLLYSERKETSDDTLLADRRYFYRGSIVHRLGKGACGFERVDTYDVLSDKKAWTENDPEKGGVPLVVKTYADSTVNTWSSTIRPNRAERVNLLSSENCDEATGVRKATIYEYGSYGLPVGITETVQESNGAYGRSNLTRVEYQNIRTPRRYQLGLPTKTVSFNGRPGEGMWMERTLVQYDTIGHPVQKDVYCGLTVYAVEQTGNPLSSTRLTYDTFGNVVSERVSDHGRSTYLETTRIWSTDGRNLLAETDPLGHTTTYSLYNSYGQPREITDHHGNSIIRTYNGWGTLIQTERPDGSFERTATKWDGLGGYSVHSSADGAPDRISHYDSAGRKTRTSEKRFDGSWLHTDWRYNLEGLLSEVSKPFKGNAATKWIHSLYDRFGRKYEEWTDGGMRRTWQYDTTSVIQKRNNVFQSRKRCNASGDLVEVEDPGGIIHYTLRGDGRPITITAPGNVETHLCYDLYGNRCRIMDPSGGTQTDTTVYLSDGGIVKYHTTANGTVTNRYDRYGKLTRTERSGSFSTDYSYNPDGNLLCEQSSNGVVTTYTYDTYGRLDSDRYSVDGINFGRTYCYDSDGTIMEVRYDKGDTIDTEYRGYSSGHLTSVSMDGNNVFSLIDEDGMGQTSHVRTGSLDRYYENDAFGMPFWRYIETTGRNTLQSLWTSFAPQTGNLVYRLDDRDEYVSESYTYDSQDRIENINIYIDGDDVETDYPLAYDVFGNLVSQDAVGSMTHGDSTHPYRVTGMTAEGPCDFPSGDLRIAYTSFGQPDTIARGAYTAEFLYNASHERVRMIVKQNGMPILTRYYLGGQYEVDNPLGENKEKLYLGGDYYSAPMVYMRQGEYDPDMSDWEMNQIFRDYLGSITNVTTYTGQNLGEYSYDTWGRLRNPYDVAGLAYDADHQPTLVLGRGYTGHEHLPWFGLINMNARLYDPVTARFLSPDPYVQAPDCTQSFNRYAYALNNPMKYTDEDGESITLATMAICAALYGVGNLCAHAFRGEDLGHWMWAKYLLTGAVAGAVVGAVGAYAYNFSSFMASIVPKGFSHLFWQVTNYSVLWTYPALTGVNFVASSVNGAVNKNDQWFNNFAKTTLGNFYLDENKGWAGQILEGISRFTWEAPQQALGYGWSGIRNFWADRVDYWGGATFVTDFTGHYNGVTLGGFININNNDTPADMASFPSFDDYMLSNRYVVEEYYIHEYGHTIQSKIWGLSYLPVPALLSLWNCRKFWDKHKTPHDNYWTEVWANTYSKQYYKRHHPTYSFPSSLNVKY